MYNDGNGMNRNERAEENNNSWDSTSSQDQTSPPKEQNQRFLFTHISACVHNSYMVLFVDY